jgi:hypothetical protein
MQHIEFLLSAIAVLLLLILLVLWRIAARLREHFPTAKEADYDWSQSDPMSHWEAHKK